MEVMDFLTLAGTLALIVLVLVLTYYATRWYARHMGQTGSGKYIKVLDRAALGAGASVTIVQIGEKYYLLGAGEKNVQLLCELPDFEERGEMSSAAAGSFSQVLRQVMDWRKAPGAGQPGSALSELEDAEGSGSAPFDSKGEGGDDHP